MSRLFGYRVQMADGEVVSLSVAAPSDSQARRSVESLGVRVMAAPPPAMETPDFATRLGRMIDGGLEMQQSLALAAMAIEERPMRGLAERAAQMLREGRTAEDVTAMVKRGLPKWRGPVIDEAGERLAVVLCLLGEQKAMRRRHARANWRMVAIAAAIVAALAGVVMLVRWWAVPTVKGMEDTYFSLWSYGFAPSRHEDWRPGLRVASVVLMILQWGIVLMACALAGVLVLRRTGPGASVWNALALTLPRIGPMIRAQESARWCDEVRIGALVLPETEAVRQAGIACRSKLLRRDSETLAARKADVPAGDGFVLPALVGWSVWDARQDASLGQVTGELARVFRRQEDAERRRLAAALGWLLVVSVGLAWLGVVFGAMFSVRFLVF